MENFVEIDPELAVNYWEDINSDLTILYEDYLNKGQNATVCGKMSEANIIAQLSKNNQAENDLSGEEES